MRPDYANRRRYVTTQRMALGVLVVAVGMAPAVAAEFEIAWRVIGSGGTSGSADAGYSLAGTIAQPVAGMSAGGGYTLDAGFWQTIPVARASVIFNDGFEG